MRWWDEGRAYYDPDNPMLNDNMIWIAGFALLILVGVVTILVGVFG